MQVPSPSAAEALRGGSPPSAPAASPHAWAQAVPSEETSPQQRVCPDCECRAAGAARSSPSGAVASPSGAVASPSGAAASPSGAVASPTAEDSEEDAALLRSVLAERLAAVKRDQLDPFLRHLCTLLRTPTPPEPSPTSAAEVQLRRVVSRLMGVGDGDGGGEAVVEACAEAAEELHRLRRRQGLPRQLRQRIRMLLFHVSAVPRAAKLLLAQLRGAAAEASTTALYAMAATQAPMGRPPLHPSSSWPLLPAVCPLTPPCGAGSALAALVRRRSLRRQSSPPHSDSAARHSDAAMRQHSPHSDPDPAACAAPPAARKALATVTPHSRRRQANGTAPAGRQLRRSRSWPCAASPTGSPLFSPPSTCGTLESPALNARVNSSPGPRYSPRVSDGDSRSGVDSSAAAPDSAAAPSPAAARPAMSPSADRRYPCSAGMPRLCRPAERVPPPLDTRHGSGVPAPSPPHMALTPPALAGATPRSSFGTPRSTARTLWRRRSTTAALTVASSAPANEQIMCRICETYVPQDVLEAHTDVCAERLTNLKVLDHILSRMRRAAASPTAEHPYCQRSRVTQSQRATLGIALELCEQAVNQVIPVLVAGIVTELSALHKEATADLPPSPPPMDGPHGLAVELLQAARDACAALAKVLQMAAQEGRELVPLTRLRDAASVGLEDFEVEGVIARGTFGRVFRVVKRRTRDRYALKVMSKRDVIKRRMTQKLLNERNIMAFSDNDLVVKLHYSFASTKYLYFAMEYLPGGDLFSLLERMTAFPENLARFYTAEIVLALEYLHSISIVHRDVKPDNILIVGNGHIKLADFGLSDVGVGFVVEGIVSMAEDCFLEDFNTPKSRAHGRRDKGGGTPDYVAPELLLGEESNKAVDYWSLGVLLFEFLAGMPPFAAEDNNTQAIFDNILRNEVSFEGFEGSAESRDLVLQLLQFAPEDRIACREKGGVAELKAHAFFRGTDWAGLPRSTPPYRPDLAHDNFSERAKVYPIDASDADFLREELVAGTPRSQSDDGSVLDGSCLQEFLGGGTSLWAFQLAAPHLAALAQEEKRRRLKPLDTPTGRQPASRAAAAACTCQHQSDDHSVSLPSPVPQTPSAPSADESV